MKRKSQEERFWDRVSKEPVTPRGKDMGCWEWIGKVTDNGYGKVPFEWEGRRANRYSYYLNVDENFDRNLFVCHTCDNPLCVKPEHLFLDTVQGNNEDKQKKNRHSHGITHGKCKLTEENVQFIRNYPREWGAQGELAEMFGIRQQTVSDIITNKIWKHL